MSLGYDSPWIDLDPTALIGGPVGVSDDVTTGGLGASGVLPNTSVAHPDHPMFWFGAFLLAAGALVFTSHHLHVGADAGVGNFTVGASAGEEHK